MNKTFDITSPLLPPSTIIPLGSLFSPPIPKDTIDITTAAKVNMIGDKELNREIPTLLPIDEKIIVLSKPTYPPLKTHEVESESGSSSEEDDDLDVKESPLPESDSFLYILKKEEPRIRNFDDELRDENVPSGPISAARDLFLEIDRDSPRLGRRSPREDEGDRENAPINLEPIKPRDLKPDPEEPVKPKPSNVGKVIAIITAIAMMLLGAAMGAIAAGAFVTGTALIASIEWTVLTFSIGALVTFAGGGSLLYRTTS